jgi:hypothetical protein
VWLWRYFERFKKWYHSGTPHYVAAPLNSEELVSPVFKHELDAINARRKACGQDEIYHYETDPVPSAELGLVGLALSGGGIRSATFNLGVLQGLEHSDVLSKIDYMSTVSGGGYIGASLSVSAAASSGPKNGNIPFPFHHSVGEQESAPFRHLRDHSRYLAPGGGLLVALRLPALFLRGLLINFLIITPMILTAVLVTILLAGPDIRAAQETDESHITIPAEMDMTAEYCQEQGRGTSECISARRSIGTDQIQPRLVGVNLSSALQNSERGYSFVRIVGLPQGVRVSASGNNGIWYRQSDHSWRLSGFVNEHHGMALLTVSADIRDPFTFTVRGWLDSNANDAKTTVNDVVDPIQNFLSVHQRFKWTKRAGVVFILLIVLFPIGLWIVESPLPYLRRFRKNLMVKLRISSRGTSSDDGYRWDIRDWASRWLLAAPLLVLIGLAIIEIQPIAIYTYIKFSDSDVFAFFNIPFLANEAVVSGIITIVIAFLSRLLTSTSGQSIATGRLKEKLMVLIIGVGGPIVVWLFYVAWCRLLLQKSDEFRLFIFKTFGEKLDFSDRWKWIADQISADHNWSSLDLYLMNAYGLLVLAIWVLTRLSYDVNKTSFHRFYRDRLSKAYLFNPWDKNGGLAIELEHADGIKLSELKHENAPYHLIHGTLNIQRSKVANMRGRNGVSFLFSKHWIGSQLTGYCSTKSMEKLDPQLDIATAIAVSGAAAAPNMGRVTQKSLTFLLALLNIRLGYWLPNPNTLAKAKYKSRVTNFLSRSFSHMFSRVGPIYLFMEMAGWLNEKSPDINISDGGHNENLGVYELLRRRCKVIIASDAEADAELQFGGLARAIRLARIDFGVSVNIKLDDIRKDEQTGFSRNQFAVGDIDYGNGEMGMLFYLKASMTGHENVYIRTYRDSNASFPHQGTGDQFFDEEQFEAYRALGYRIGRAVNI